MLALAAIALTTAIEVFAAGAATTVTIYSIYKTGKKKQREKNRLTTCSFF